MKNTLKMKRMAALSLALLAALGLAAAPALAETVQTDTPVAEQVPVDPQTVFDRAADQLLGVNYELLALAERSQLTEDVEIYAFLCKGTAAVPGAEPRLCVLLAADLAEEGILPMGVIDCPSADEDGVLAFPDAEYLAANFFRALAQLPAGTAGASLQAARQVTDLWLICAMYDFAALDAETVSRNLSSGLLALAEEERALYVENAAFVLSEALRLCDPDEVPGGEYEDAGSAEALAALRAEESVRASVQAFLGLLDGLEP